MATVDSILQSIASTDGVRAALVASNDGLVVHGYKAQHADEELESLAAVTAGVVSSLQALARELGRPALTQAVAEFGQNTLVVQPIDDETTLVVSSDGTEHLGRLRFMVHRHAPTLGELLKQF